MNPNVQFQNTDAFILCGGFGTRLRTVVNDRPKVLAKMDESKRAFLDLILSVLAPYGFGKIVLGVGYLGDHIKERYAGVPNIVFSEEKTPLGTGGAVKHAEHLIGGNNFFVLNGDTVFSGLDLSAFYDFHNRSAAVVSLALAKPREEKDFGSVSLATDNRIARYDEKTNMDESGMMNGGVYVMNRGAFALMPEGQFSLEKDFFPRLAADKKLYGWFSEGTVIDIGTPERYEFAKSFFS